jgi:Family of unknown function (DUF6200)
METGMTSEPQVVVVDLGERQMPDEVNRLRNGQGKLFDHVERIIADLVAAGTVAASAQPVVLVVRELSSPGDDEEEDNE